MMHIVETHSENPDFQQFVDFPKGIYLADLPKFAVSESIPTEFHAGSFLLFRNDKVVARASLYHNPQLYYKNQPACTVGNYECIEDESCAKAILERVTQEARTLGANYLLGPMNGSTWEKYRFATDHEQPPFFLEPYHHLYYNEQFRKAGFSPIAGYYTNIDTEMVFDHPKVLIRTQEFKETGVIIRPIDLIRFEEELVRIHDFNNLAFTKNFLFTPIDLDSFLRKYLSAKAILHPEFTLIAEDKDRNLIGYYFCFDDLLKIAHKSLIVKTLARHPNPKWKGLGHVMGNLVVKKAVALGYDSMLHPFMYNHGTSHSLSENFSGNNYRNYLLYGKAI